jgi:hypothetical protein
VKATGDDFVSGIVRSKVCKLAISLKFFVVTGFKTQINPTTNKNSVFSHQINVTIFKNLIRRPKKNHGKHQAID